MTSGKNSKGEEQLVDGIYVLRQMVEKKLEVHGSMVLGFVDLEKAFDAVPMQSDGDGDSTVDALV